MRRAKVLEVSDIQPKSYPATKDWRRRILEAIPLIMSRVKRAPMVPVTILAGFVLVSIFADVLAPWSPYAISLPNKLQPPFWQDGGSFNHLLGTDLLGRDVLSRLIHGARVSLVVAIASLVLGAAFGVAIGIVSGYFRGKVDAIATRIIDTMITFPTLFFALLLAVVLGASLLGTVIAISLVMWARYARVIRGEVLSLRERDFVALAKIAGCSPAWIIRRHILPNVANLVMVIVSLQVGWVIVVEASLSFLGVGVPPPTPSWGSMVSEGRNYVVDAWWLSAFPGLFITLVVLSFNLFGDWLRDTLDPTLRQL